MSISQWSMHKKLASLDEQLHTADLYTPVHYKDTPSLSPSTSQSALPSSAAPAAAGSGLTSALVSACALVSCGVASTYAYSSYTKWQRKSKRTTTCGTDTQVEAEPVTTTATGKVSELLSNLRTVYNTFTSREKSTQQQVPVNTNDAYVHEGHREILSKHSKLLTALRNNLTKAQVEFSTDDTQLLNTTVEQLSEKFLVSVVGEFNSGKSAFINALLGGRFVQEGILPTTDFITKITYDEHESFTRNSAQNMMEVKLPVPWLKEVTIVDTPGTNALFELGHQAITEKFLPHSDLVLFVTSAERPLTESERQIIKRIRDWGRKIVVVVNKCDLRTEEEKQEVVEYVRKHVSDLIPDLDFPIFPISARLALMSKIQSCYQEDTERAPWQDLWVASNIGCVERYMFHSLDDIQKMRVKLRGPLSVANKFLSLYDEKLQESETKLGKEKKLLSDVDALINTHYQELLKDFQKLHLDQIESSFTRLLEGTDDFVDHHISFASFMHFVMHPSAMQGTFREEVCQNFQTEVEGVAVKLTDWLTEVRSRMVEKVLQALNAVSDRSTTVNNVWKNIRVAPVVLGQDHQLELRQFRESVQAIIEKFTADERHSRALVDSVRTSMTQIMAVEGCAAMVGLMWYSSFWVWLQARHGASTAERFFSMFTGPETSVARELAKPIPLLLLGVGTILLGVSGLNILQYRRNAVKKKLAREAGMCHDRLKVKLETFVTEKARKTVSDTELWLQPFLQAIKTEHERIEEVKGLVTGWHEDVNIIGTQIEDVTEQMAQSVPETEGDIYPVSKPLAYPTATPLGPTKAQSAVRKPSFVNAPPSYTNDSPYYLPAASCYPSLERAPSLRATGSAPLRSPQHFTYQTYPPAPQHYVSQQPQPSPRLYRQASPPIFSSPPQTPVSTFNQAAPQTTPSQSATPSPASSEEDVEIESPPSSAKKVVLVPA